MPCEFGKNLENFLRIFFSRRVKLEQKEVFSIMFLVRQDKNNAFDLESNSWSPRISTLM